MGEEYLFSGFKQVILKNIPREENKGADKLASKAVKTVQRLLLFGSLTVFVAVASLIYQGYQLTTVTNATVRATWRPPVTTAATPMIA